jgi:predicted CoA-binding protein
MPKYTYKPNKGLTEETYKENTETDVYEALGDVDFSKISLVVIAKDEEESEAIRKAVTDIRMWVQESVEDEESVKD